jgi:ectoine hydroxylase-related dioxygenase (phytanoyl-CoA dioxygenase family)
MEKILGSDLQCSFYHTNTACPGSGIQPVHRDAHHLFGSDFPVATPTCQVVLNVPLCDFTIENGSTEYWPGTHMILDPTPESTKQFAERAALFPSVRLNMKAGSFALRDLRAWHRGMPNDADYARTMFALVYQRGFLNCKQISIPQSVWDSWGEKTRHIFRRNHVVADEEHRALTWEELRG